MNACHTCINHVADTGNGERGFGDVGGEYDTTLIGRPENAILFGIRQARIQRQDFSVRRMMFAQCFIAIANLAFTRQEDQNVAFTGFKENFVYRL